MGGLIEVPFVKQPWEQRRIRFNWAEDCQPLIDNGYAFSTVEALVYDEDGNDVSATLLNGTASRTGNFVFATIMGGTSGINYYCRVRVTLSKSGYTDEQIEADLLIQVVQKGK